MNTKEVRKLIAKCKQCRYCSDRDKSWLGKLVDRIFGLDIYVKCRRPSNMIFNIVNFIVIERENRCQAFGLGNLRRNFHNFPVFYRKVMN